MRNRHPTDQEIARALKPWHSAFASLLSRAEESVLAAHAVLGLARPTERANDFHRVQRNLFRAWCDETNDLFRFVEEPDGQGLDCIVCSVIPSKPFLIRFGRLKGQTISRNTTRRQSAARAFGTLSSDLLFTDIDDPEPGELRQVTLSYTIEDEGTAGGRPRWFMERVVLLVEHFDCVDKLAEIANYSRPRSIADDARRAVVVPREDELALWRGQIQEARNSA